MHFSTIFIALAATATAQNLVTYNCNNGLKECKEKAAAGKTASSICQQEFVACQGCSTQEHSCRAAAGTNYSAQLECTAPAQICYNNAVSPGTTLGIYDCQAAQDSCDIAPMTNHSYCGAQNGECKSCQAKEKKCRNAKGANQSLCASEASECFAKAMELK